MKSYHRKSAKTSRALRPKLAKSVFATLSSAILISSLFGQLVFAQLPGGGDQLDSAKQLVDRGQLNEARALYQNILARQPDSAEALAGLGHVQLLEGDCRAAEETLAKAKMMQPANANILNDLGNAAYRQEHLPKAIDYFEQALKYASKDAYKVDVNLANALSDNQQIDEAIQHFAHAIQLKNDYAPAYNGLATMYYNNKKYAEAAQRAREAIQRKPDYAMAYYNLGISLIQLGKTSEARDALKHSLQYEKNPAYKADTRRILAGLTSSSESASGGGSGAYSGDFVSPSEIEQLLKAKEWAEAERAINTEIKAGGERRATLWNNLGYAQMHQNGKYKQAKASFEKAIQLSNGRNSSAHYNLGQLLRLMNDNHGAELAFRRSIEDAKLTKTPCPLAQNALGLLLKQKKDFAGADACYRRALMDSDGELSVVHYNRALLLERMDNSRDAVREYKLYLSREPNGLNARQAALRLKMLGIDPG